MTKASENQFPYVTFAESASPGTPASGLGYVYASTGGTPYYVNDAGAETSLLGGGSGDVATDAIWDAAGDLAVGTGANTATRLAIGNAGGVVSRVNGSVAWNSGTAFPTAATGDRYWRTDRGLEFYYDGTRWLTTTLFRMDAGFVNAAGYLTGTNGIWASPTDISGLDLWVVSAKVSAYVLTTNNGSNYWTLTFAKADSAFGETSIATANTSADSADTLIGKSITVGASVAVATYSTITFGATKVSSPGNIRAHGALMYRLIGT